MSKGIAFIRLITGNGRQRLSGSSDKAAVFVNLKQIRLLCNC